MARDEHAELGRTRQRQRHPSEALEFTTVPTDLSSRSLPPVSSQELEYATIPSSPPRLDTRSDALEGRGVRTGIPGFSPLETRRRPSRHSGSSGTTSNFSRQDTRSHPSEELDFITVSSGLSPLDIRPLPSANSGPTNEVSILPKLDISVAQSKGINSLALDSGISPSDTRKHPSEHLEFSTVPTNISGLDSRPHPSENLEFTTVPTCISGLSQIRSNGTETMDFATALSASDTLRSRSDTADLSSIVSGKPRVNYLEYAEDGSPSPSGARPDLVRRDTLESVEFGVRQRMHSVNELMMRLAQGIPGLNLADAKKATQAEQRMTLKEGLKMYPKAIAWSLMLSFTLVMEGYDLSIINGFYAFPVFKRRFGQLTPNAGYEITTSWQSALTNGAVVGEILGLFFNGTFYKILDSRRLLTLVRYRDGKNRLQEMFNLCAHLAMLRNFPCFLFPAHINAHGVRGIVRVKLGRFSGWLFISLFCPVYHAKHSRHYQLPTPQKSCQ